MDPQSFEDKISLFLELLSLSYFKDSSKPLKDRWKDYQKQMGIEPLEAINTTNARISYHSPVNVDWDPLKNTERNQSKTRVTNSQFIKSPPRVREYEIYLPNKQTPSTDVKSISVTKEDASMMALSQERIEKERLESVEKLINPKKISPETNPERKKDILGGVSEVSTECATSPMYRAFDVLSLKELTAYLGEKGRHVVERLSEENSQMTFLKMPTSSPIMSAFLIILIKQISMGAIFSENTGTFYNQLQELSLRFLHKKDLKNHDKFLKHLNKISKIKDYSFRSSKEVLKNLYYGLNSEKEFYEMFMLLLKYIVVYFVIEAKVAVKGNMNKTTENLSKKLSEIKINSEPIRKGSGQVTQEEECLVFLSNTFNKIVNIYDVDSSECHKYMPSVFIDHIVPGLLKRDIIDKCIMIKQASNDKKEIFLEIPSSERVNFEMVAESRLSERGSSRSINSNSYENIDESKHRHTKSYEKDQLFNISNELTNLLSALTNNSKKLEEIILNPSKEVVIPVKTHERANTLERDPKPPGMPIQELTKIPTRKQSPLTVEKIMKEAKAKKSKKSDLPIFEPFVRRRDSSRRSPAPALRSNPIESSTQTINLSFNNNYGPYNSSFIPSTIVTNSQENLRFPNHQELKKENIKLFSPQFTSSSPSIWTSSLTARSPVPFMPQTSTVPSGYQGGYRPTVSYMNSGYGKTAF